MNMKTEIEWPSSSGVACSLPSSISFHNMYEIHKESISILTEKINNLRTQNIKAVEIVSELEISAKESSSQHFFYLTTFAYIDYLESNPSPEAWIFITDLRWHSHGVESCFFSCFVDRIKQNDSFKKQFCTEIVPAIIDQTIKKPGRRDIRNTSYFKSAKKEWMKKASLEKMWRDMRFNRIAPYKDDDEILVLLLGIDIEVYVQEVSKFDYPDPVVATLLLFSRLYPLSIWKELLALAPAAFDDKFQWKGSFLLPIMLELTLYELAPSNFMDREDQTLTAEGEEKLTIFLDAIIHIIKERSDKKECARVWGIRVMEQMLANLGCQDVAYPNDYKNPSYYLGTFLDKLCPLFSGEAEEVLPLGMFRESFAWIDRALMIEANLNDNKDEIYPFDEFLQEFDFKKFNGWSDGRLASLSEKVGPFIPTKHVFDNYGLRLLAFPLSADPAPVLKYKQLYESAAPLRDFLLFGVPPNQNKTKHYEVIRRACDVFKFVFGLGLMTLDWIADEKIDVSYNRQKQAGDLFSFLWSILKELSLLSNFDVSFQNEAYIHMVIRRYIYNDCSNICFNENSDILPFEEFFNYLKGDVEQLSLLLDALLRNQVSIGALKTVMTAVDIDPHYLIQKAKEIITIHDQRSQINHDLIERLEKKLC